MSEPPLRLTGIAIVGMACRLPGARTPRQYWENLCAGVESIRHFTDEELIEAGVPTTALEHPDYVKAAPLLEDVDQFDAGFFGYSPREAALIDPQHRLLLEVAWDAFEDAGYDPERTEQVVGVFAGGGGVVTSYLMAHQDHEAFPGQTGGIEHISNDKDFLSTRVSYKLNLTGPSLTVQTACSTSLVALHLACQSLESGECDMALAGASTVRIPHVSGYMAPRGSIYSSDGRCRAFDANGTGTIFGSGVAAVLLKPLEDAVADGDHIHAVVKSTAVNNDGGRKVSYTAPSAVGEARAMAEALALADVPAESIRFVECHATGTTVGDPLEVQALSLAFRTQTDREGFCAVGSAKTNIGHAEQAAGMAGLIKAALALENSVIPPTRVETPNPDIPFEGSPFYLNRDVRPWPEDDDGPRRAAVNSLGIGGTNAFAVLEQAPETPEPDVQRRETRLLCLSAKDETALRARAGQMARVLSDAPEDRVDRICHTANRSRSRFVCRLGLVGSRDELVEQLEAYGAGGPGNGIATSDATPGTIAFLFSGQGFQYPGMAASLYETQPAFRDSLDACAAALAPHLETPILDVIFGADGVEDLVHQTRYTQPALFAVEYALATMWGDWGVAPDAVMGHSVGEIAACAVAGVFTLEQAAELIAARAELMQSVSEAGGMLAAFADEATTRNALSDLPSLSVAAVNAPTNTVVSGPAADIEEAEARLEALEVACKRLQVSHAFHSELMDPILDALDDVGDRIRGREPSVPVVTNLDGRPLAGAPAPDHWSRHARGAVHFSEGMRTLVEEGHTTFVEIGPGSGLLSLGRLSANGPSRWVASLDPRRSDWAVLLESVRQLFLAGHDLHWDEIDRGFDQRKVPLPTYPFQRSRYWLSDAPTPQRVQGIAPSSETVLAAHEIELTLERMAQLRDHRIHGEVVFPTTLILTEAMAAGQDRLGARVEVRDLQYHRALVLGHQLPPSVRLEFETHPDGLTFRLLASTDGVSWHRHATGVLTVAEDLPEVRAEPDAHPDAARAVSANELYPALRAVGLEYGPVLRGVNDLEFAEGSAWFTVVEPGGDTGPIGARPLLLDACLHAYPLLSGDCMTDQGAEGESRLPIGFERVAIAPDASVGEVRVVAKLRPEPRQDGAVLIDIDVFDERGDPVAWLHGLALSRVPSVTLRREGDQLVRDSMYRLDWQTSDAPTEPRAYEIGRWILFADRGGVAAALAEELEARGQRCRLVHRSGEVIDESEAAVVEDDPATYRQRLRALMGDDAIPLRGVVNAWPLDAPDVADLTPERLAAAEASAARATLHLLQALEAEGSSGTRIWSLTRNGATVGVDVEPLQSAVLGLARTLALEHPGAWGGVIDLAPDLPPGPVATEFLVASDDREVALRSTGRYVPRLVSMSDSIPTEPEALRTDGIILVTGGLGMLGRETVRWLADCHGIRMFVLTGRSPLRPEGEEFIEELARQGVEAVYESVDVTDATDVAALFVRLAATDTPLRGIVHSAGVLADRIVSRMSWEDFTRGTAPKLRGAWLLHHHARDMDLDLFLVHSSLLSWTGSVGQVNYTAGNGFLDGLVAHRRAHGLPASGINWGPWADEGMATQSGERGREIWRRLGVEYIERETGVRALELIHQSGVASAALTVTDWNRFAAAQPASGPLLREVTSEERTSEGASTSAPPEGWADHLRATPPDERREVLVEALCAEAALELGFPDPIPSDKPLSELGLDSLISVNLANRIEHSVGLAIPLVYIVRGPSVDALVDKLAGDPQFVDLPVAAKPSAPRRATEPSNGVPVAPATVSSNGRHAPAGTRSDGRWLVFPEPRPEARLRLFCFPYAGAGAPVFQPWASGLDPSIELVAVEPPGRAGRVDEEPLVSMTRYVDELMQDMEAHLDTDIALFGHCQGAMNLYEIARALTRHPRASLTHVFVSGARPPHHLFEIGPFEETLTEGLLGFSGFDPVQPLHEQPDDVFSEALRHFDIGATDQFLENPELRGLLLPAVRADFETLTNYKLARDEPWHVPITCLVGLSDTYVSRRNAIGWSEYTQDRFSVHYLDSSHYMIVEERDAIIDIINHDLAGTPLERRDRGDRSPTRSRVYESLDGYRPV